jgi:hypothetical protein
LPEDGVLRYEFFTNSAGFLPRTPEAWEGLVGLYVEAEVTRGRNGYTIEDDNGVYRLFDVKTEGFIELKGGIPNEFESYTTAREAAAAQGLYRAWNEINKFNPSLNHVQSNAEVLKSLMKDSL